MKWSCTSLEFRGGKINVSDFSQRWFDETCSQSTSTEKLGALHGSPRTTMT